MRFVEFRSKIDALLRDWRGGTLGFDEMADRFETLCYQLDFASRELPRPLTELVNRIERIRFAELESGWPPAVSAVLEEALRLDENDIPLQ